MALTQIKTTGLADSAVTTAKINDDAVTDAKVADAITVTGAQTGITQTGTLTSFASTGIDDNATSTAITIDSSENVTLASHLVLPYGEINDAGTDVNIVSTNALTLQTSAGTAITIPNASTNVGIGTTSPEGQLSFLASESNTPKIRFQNTHSVTGDGAISSYDDADGTTLVFGSNFYLNSSGASTRFNTSEQSSAVRVDRGGLVQFYTGGTGSTATERMRIASSGNVRIGTDTTNDIVNSNYSLHVKDTEGIAAEATANGGVCFLANKNASNNDGYYFLGYDSAFKFQVEMDGDVYNTNGTYGTITSDIRLKENIKDATSKLNDLNSLNVKNFNYIGNDKKQIGFIADEFQQVFPSLVTESDTRVYDDDGNVISGFEDAKGLKVGMEFAILVKAIQELSAKVEALENA